MVHLRFWLTVGMAEWDGPALAHLQEVTGQLTGVGVTAVMAELIGTVFRRNVARHEPTEAGDTAQSLAWVCAVNISQLVPRHYAGPDAPAAGLVRATRPDSNSLLVQACGVDLRVRKAPGDTLSPRWSAFSWQESDGVGRHQAAEANAAAYQPAASDQDGRPTTLDPGAMFSLDDPTALRQVMLAWAGDMDTGLTAGWLGFPCTDTPSWFAVTPLWRDKSGADSRPADLRPAPLTPPGSYTDQPELAPKINLRRPAGRPDRTGQA